ncbi:hypothetical protein TTHERM_00210490 (macronuclear) [Tetrahymena thermophila SB210]|uniref:Transmembrane protein n=1 Tax=Tetrahymena thermophila (strain SB210) TaxID=312017 RepID=Q22N89_TETTS|nr:hypothetical protein TTHERM_00210490 [Tetrahymena thermophila SB210]EAR86896.2 hypothetical protein TTHERM_00210490 [Tetrahymena thermophila SB210]|eukprot:XP_001007141.2 hypothetical protein TTHERM_00210490 [Tetrahymena thermophila SB210]
MVLLFIAFRMLIIYLRIRQNFYQNKKRFQKDCKKALVFQGQAFIKCIYGGNKKSKPMLYIQNMGKEVKILDLFQNSFTQINISQGKLLELYKKQGILVIFQDHFVTNKIYLYHIGHKRLINQFNIKADQLVPNDQDMLVATKYTSSYLTNTMSIVNLLDGQVMYLCELMCKIHLFIKFQECYYLFFTENDQLYVWIFNKNFLSGFQKWFYDEQNQGENLEEQQNSNQPNSEFQIGQDQQIELVIPERNQNEINEQIVFNNIQNNINSFEQYKQHQKFNLPNNLKIDEENQYNQVEWNQSKDDKNLEKNIFIKDQMTDSNIDTDLINQQQNQVQDDYSLIQQENKGNIDSIKSINQKLHICSSNPNLTIEIVRLSDKLVLINKGIQQLYFDLGCQEVVKKQSDFLLDVRIKKIQNCEGGYSVSNDLFNEYYNYESKIYQSQGYLSFAIANNEFTSLLYGERVFRYYQLQEDTCIFKKRLR